MSYYPIKIFLFVFAAGIIFYSCAKPVTETSPVFHVGETLTRTIIFSNGSANSAVIDTIPAGKTVFIKRKYKKYYLIIFNNSDCYILQRVIKNFRNYYNDQGEVLYVGNSKLSSQTGNSSPGSMPTSTDSNSGGQVQVKGYYRKNGTYVSPYTRSAPRKH